jgi:hypothetical protein
MADLADRYAAWRAPQDDCSVLLWPEPGSLLADAAANNRSLRAASAGRIQNAPLPDLRQAFRRFLGVHDDNQLVFATGHQTELHHPGVWAKNVLIDAAAAKAGGLAVHVAVDTDAPKHLSLRFPGFGRPFTDDEKLTAADWAGQLNPPTPIHLQQLADDVERAAGDWPFVPSTDLFFDVARRWLLEAETLPGVLTAALHEYDWGLGLRYSAMLASPLWQSPPFLAFAHHLLANADRFAADYNAGLRAYRERNHIKTPGRPMPDLARKDDRCETPFWRDDLARGHRVRAWVDRGDDGQWALAAGDGDRLPLRPGIAAHTAADHLLSFLRKHHLRLAPRALTLTMTLRLLAADQFVHGIGGGQYDQVADEVIARHFGIDPPRFAVTTATLYWPPAAGRRRTSIPDLLQAGHRLRHGLLGPRKRELAAAINAAPRQGVERQALFQQMHQELGRAAAQSPELREWEEALRGSAAQVVEERAIFDRELFYPIQPRERLERVIADYRGRFA